MQPKTSSSKNTFSILLHLFQYIWKKYKLFFFCSFFLIIISKVLFVLYPNLIKVAVDENIKQKNISALQVTVLAMLFCLVVSFITQVIYINLINYVGQKVIFDLRKDLMKKVFSLKKSFYDRTPIGRVLTNITNDVEALKDFLSDGILSLFTDGLTVILIFGFLIYINWYLTVSLLGVVVVFFVGILLFQRILKKGFIGVRKSNSDMNTLLVEIITGIKEIILFHQKKKMLKKFDKSNKKYLSSYVKVIHGYSLFFPFVELISFLALIIVLLAVSFQTNFQESIQGQGIASGTVIAFFAYISMLFRPLRHLAEQINSLQSAIVAGGRVFSFLEVKEEIQDDNPYLNKKFLGNISFQNVSFSYNERKKILQEISFEIKAGEKIAIVGSTGSGKTTIISLMNRLYEINSGKITIDGEDIQNVSIENLRESIATLPQDAFLFTDDVKNNISLGKKYSLQEIKNASKKVLADEFIQELPKKYDTQVMEEGKSISFGQRQLISLARAFIQKKNIVILDESTANIDNHSEVLIQEGLNNFLQNKTAIIIAHRFSTIRNVDKILVLNKGKVLEFGTHAELMKNKGEYYKLYQLHEE